MFEAVVNDPKIQDGFNRFYDKGIINHCLGVGWLASGIGIEMGLDEDPRALGMLLRSSLLHDVLKKHKIIYPAVVSPKIFEQESPDNVCGSRTFQLIQHHAVWGAVWIHQNGFGDNAAVCVASHHGFQTQRPAYGILAEDIRAYPESDGYVPPTLLCATALASADVFHARTAPPEENSRHYGLVPSAEDGLASVYSLRADEAVKQATARVTGFEGLNFAAAAA